MVITISAPQLTKPTYETLEEYATKKLQKLKRHLHEKDSEGVEVRVGVEKTKSLFELIIEVFHLERVVVKVQDEDLRAAINSAVDTLIRNIERKHEKKIHV